MNSSIKKALLSASIIFGLIIATGAFAVFAESDKDIKDIGIHIPDLEISVYSPITDMIDFEIDVNIQSLFKFSAQDTSRMRTFVTIPMQCEDTLVVHQEQIDKILALVDEFGIDNLQDLYSLLQALQSEGNYLSGMPFGCGGVCVVIRAWVIINGVRYPAFVCISCGSIFIIT